MDDTFFDGHDELYHHAKFGEDRTTRAGCRCENVVFVFFVGHAPSPLLTYLPCVRVVHSSNKNCVDVYCRISMRFSAFFSQVILLSDALHSSHIRR